MRFAILTGKCPLRTFSSRDSVFVGCKQLLPFRVRLLHPLIGRRAAISGIVQYIRPFHVEVTSSASKLVPFRNPAFYDSAARPICKFLTPLRRLLKRVNTSDQIYFDVFQRPLTFFWQIRLSGPEYPTINYQRIISLKNLLNTENS